MDLFEKIRQNKRNVTPKQLIELLESHGFKFIRSKGDHFYYKQPGYRTFPVPVRQNPLAIHIVQEALQLIEEIRNLEE